MASSTADHLPDASPPPINDSIKAEQQPSAEDQLQAAASSPSPLQQQPSALSNATNSNGNATGNANGNGNGNGMGNDPFQCLWQGCRERTQSAEALYVRLSVPQPAFLHPSPRADSLPDRITCVRSTSVAKAPTTST